MVRYTVAITHPTFASEKSQTYLFSTHRWEPYINHALPFLYMFFSFVEKYFKISSCLGIIAISLLKTPAYAQQIIEDGTLPTRVKTIDNLNFTIDSINNKNRVGNNLFHSFKEFSIPIGGSAIFNNSTDVVNIINRVTGGNISNIDGLIKANGNANLFLINPNGIVFGKDAQLDIGGSFFGSTAQSIKFGDDIEFSAIDTTTEPLLSINVPLGLQMGSNSGAIEVQGDGYTTTPRNTDNSIDFFAPFIVTSVNGLRVKEGNTLALVGSEISLNGGIVAADSGKVELGALNKGLVNINSTTQGWNLDYKDNTQSFGDINLSSKALADASGTGRGSIQLQGRNISIKDGSRVFIQSQGNTAGEQIEVNGTQSIKIIGSRLNENLDSSLFTETVGIGNAADIVISTPNFLLSQGADIYTQTFSSARGGNINIYASQTLQINQLSHNNSTQKFSSNDNPSFVIANSFGTGDGGNIFVSTEKLTIIDDGGINSTTVGIGLGGDVNINAQSIKIMGFDFDNFTPSFLGANTYGIGDAGSLTINTQSLVIQDGGRVDSSTLASGNSGSITINARDFIEVTGTVSGSINPSLIISSANIVDESLQQFLGVPAIPSGNSGNVTINTPVLKVSNGAEVTVRNDGTGKGGILNINANSILTNSKGKITASTQSGEGGNINLQVEDGLILRNQSLVSAESMGAGNGGNININSPLILGIENSDIISNAVQGNGGNININTSGLFGLQFRDELSTKNDITASSQFGVNGTVEINNPAIDPSSSLTQLPIDVISSQQIANGCGVGQGNSFTVVGKGGLPKNPTDVITHLNLWNDLRDLNVNNIDKRRSIQVKSDYLKPIVEATGWVIDKQGNVEFIAQSVNVNVLDGSHKVSNCKGKGESI
ncbi:filamentous hemagglutinin family outer membrane protein [Calothrix parasitica NIES-267]|uniref:Filamentous hemagglutinin family outer membrane protein n=1 Tax=Calothrix parasitica NIES-267 TaxID=1973488 RepID=A0A1Z4LHV2_9CYAN|nr:filamentous hemagglutinin family outer membrane protein [Calothrix parasitica NIES-267]